jgi:DNA-binding transcriptional MerR regulator
MKAANKLTLNTKDLLRVSELAKASGVSLTTIHYYTREGLIKPFLKTAGNMAYYSPSMIDVIRQIKELQTKKYLPLSVIKMLLASKQEGQDKHHVAEMESVFSSLFQPLDSKNSSRQYSLSELAAQSGISTAQFMKLEKEGLLVPQKSTSESTYDEIDLKIVSIYKRLVELGFEPHDYSLYRKFIEIVRQETDFIHSSIHCHPQHETIPIQEVFAAFTDLKRFLTLKVYREEVAHSLKRSFPGGKK